MNSVPPAVSPCRADDTEVAPRQASGQEEMVLEEPQGNPPDPRSKGDETPQGSKSGFMPDTAPNSTVPVRVGELLPRGVSHLSQRPPPNRRRRTICWRSLR